MGIMDIQTRKMIAGDLPNRAAKMLAEWVEIHEKELMQIWETQNFVELPPLE